jgi:hypothetical protein
MRRILGFLVFIAGVALAQIPTGQAPTSKTRGTVDDLIKSSIMT